MEQTTQSTQPRRRGTGRARGSARGGATTSRDTEYDLLTAALIGVAIGVGTTLLLRSGPSGSSPAFAIVRGAGQAGMRMLPQRASRAERLRRMLAKKVAAYADSAKEQVDELAAHELRDLRRAIRRRRRQLGL